MLRALQTLVLLSQFCAPRQAEVIDWAIRAATGADVRERSAAVIILVQSPRLMKLTGFDSHRVAAIERRAEAAIEEARRRGFDPQTVCMFAERRSRT